MSIVQHQQHDANNGAPAASHHPVASPGGASSTSHSLPTGESFAERLSNALTSDITIVDFDGEPTRVKQPPVHRFLPKSWNAAWHRLVVPPLIVRQQKAEFRAKLKAKEHALRQQKLDRLIDRALAPYALSIRPTRIPNNLDAVPKAYNNESTLIDRLQPSRDAPPVDLSQQHIPLEKLESEVNPQNKQSHSAIVPSEAMHQYDKRSQKYETPSTRAFDTEDDIEAQKQHANATQKLSEQSQTEFTLDTTDASKQFVRRLTAEWMGTAMLVFTFGAAAIESSLGNLPVVGVAAVDGLSLMLLVYSLGGISGAHLNPCVSLAFAMRRVLPVAWLVAYAISQLIGSLIGAALLRAIYGWKASAATNQVNTAEYRVVIAMIYEMFLTFLLIFTILLTSTRGKVVGANAALAVGGAMGVCMLLGSNYSSGSMNPFRTFGPAIVVGGNRGSSLYCFAIGPILGSILAVIALRILSGSRKTDEFAAAGTGGTEAEDEE